MGFAPLPSDYILTSSNTTLESLELARMNAASNLRKELHDVVEEWVEAEVQARMARWVRQRGQFECTATNIAPSAIAESATQSQSSPNELLSPPDALAPGSIAPDPTAANSGGQNEQPLVAQFSAEANPKSPATIRLDSGSATLERHSIAEASPGSQSRQTFQANPPPASRRSRNPQTRNVSMSALRSLEHWTSLRSRRAHSSLERRASFRSRCTDVPLERSMSFRPRYVDRSADSQSRAQPLRSAQTSQPTPLSASFPACITLNTRDPSRFTQPN